MVRKFKGGNGTKIGALRQTAKFNTEKKQSTIVQEFCRGSSRVAMVRNKQAQALFHKRKQVLHR